LVTKDKLEKDIRKREKDSKELEEYMLIVKKDLEQIDSSFTDKKLSELDAKLKKVKIPTLQTELNEMSAKIYEWRNKLIDIK